MVFNNSILLGAGGQTTGQAPFDSTLIGNSIWLDGSADFLNRQNSSAFANRKEVTLSFWVQRNKFASQQAIFAGLENGEGFIIQFKSDDTFQLYLNGSANLTTNAVFRDIGWYHILVSIDTSQAASFNRSKVYINGEQITSFSSAAYPVQDSNIFGISGEMTSSENMRIGNYNNGVSNFYFWNGYIAQACMIESKSIQQGDFTVSDFLDTYTFGTNGSQFIPKKDSDIAALASAAGGNSFCLDFSDSSGTDAANLGNDISSNNNDFTPTSMAAANQSVHTPSKVYAAWNPLRNYASDASTLSEGNLTIASGTGPVLSTKAIPSTGKWVVTAEVSQRNFTLGVATESVGTSKLGTDSKGFCMVETTVDFRSRTGNVDTNITSALNAGDKVIAAFDADTGKLWLGADTGSGYTYLGGGNPATGATPTFTISSTETLYFAAGSQGGTFACDFGQNNFDGTVPSGFQSLNSSNLTAPDFQGIDYFDATLYEGNGTGQRVGDFVPFTDAYTVDKSAMFEEADKRYLSFTPSAGGDQKTWTFSTWFKLSADALSQRNTFLCVDDGSKEAQINHMGDQSNKNIKVNLYNGSSFVATLTTAQEIRRQDQWYHLVVAVDTRAAVASANKIKVYINGVQQTLSGTFLSTNDYETEVNSENEHNIGRQTNNGVGEPSWYLAETVMVEGSQLDPTSFGQVDTSTNRWVPKDVSGLTFGAEGWYLEFDGTGFGSGGSGETPANGAGKDSSGNNNHWEEENDSGSDWSTSDQFTDTPSKNFATLDPGRNQTNNLSEGNLKIGPGDANWDSTQATIGGLTSGKWYLEFTPETAGSNIMLGLSANTVDSSASTLPTGTNEYAYYFVNGNIYSNDINFSYGSAVGAGVVVGMAIDLDGGAIYFSKNGTFENSGNPVTGTNPAVRIVKGLAYNIVVAMTNSITTANNTINFGAKTSGFASTPPTGYKALNQDNLDDTASKLTALAWIKNRDAADDNIWMDRVIGTSGYLSTTQNDSGSAATSHGDGGTDILTTNANVVQRFLQRGVQVGNDENVNTANESYVLWQWLLGDSATTGSSITTGSPSLATTGIVSDANHFSIVQYTGNGSDNATFAHGLGSTPNFVMVKRISGSATNTDWVIHIPGLGTENYIYPHYRIALAVGAGQNGMVPDANLVEISTGVATNTSGATHMAYSFKNTPGLCKIGTYTGNSSTNGTYVSTGFKPRFIWIFNTTLTSADAERPIIDTARYKFNGATTAGGDNGGINFSDQRAAEEAQNTSLGVNPAIDILSDGFKLRANDSTINTGTTYLYISMAEIAGNGTLPPVYGR